MNAQNTKRISKTDWARVDALPDDEIDTSDIPALDESFFARAALRSPQPLVSVTLRLDPDILAWFRAQGDEYERRLNAALRIYVEAHRAYNG